MFLFKDEFSDNKNSAALLIYLLDRNKTLNENNNIHSLFISIFVKFLFNVVM